MHPYLIKYKLDGGSVAKNVQCNYFNELFLQTALYSILIRDQEKFYIHETINIKINFVLVYIFYLDTNNSSILFYNFSFKNILIQTI